MSSAIRRLPVPDVLLCASSRSCSSPPSPDSAPPYLPKASQNATSPVPSASSRLTYQLFIMTHPSQWQSNLTRQSYETEPIDITEGPVLPRGRAIKNHFHPIGLSLPQSGRRRISAAPNSSPPTKTEPTPLSTNQRVRRAVVPTPSNLLTGIGYPPHPLSQQPKHFENRLKREKFDAVKRWAAPKLLQIVSAVVAYSRLPLAAF